MKKLTIVLFSLLIMLYCKSQTNEKVNSLKSESLSNDFQITVDTLNISIDGDLRKIVLFKGNYYGIFETARKNTSQSFKKMIVFSPQGDFIEDAFVPEEIQDMFHYDLRVENDSLLIKESQFEKHNFVLGTYVADFIKTKTRELKFYEDEFFDVYASFNGEWGGTIYFKNKKTNEIYEAASTCPFVINKIDNEYYVTNYLKHLAGHTSVLKIADPTKLEKSDFNLNRHKGSQYIKGVETILDTINFYIPTSFVADEQLFHLYSDDNGSYIGKIENGKIRPVYIFDFIFHAHFCQHLDNGKQLLTCNFKDSEKSGMLIIDGGKFKFYRQK